MDAEMTIAFGIVTVVAFIMIAIGIFQFKKKDNPVGFYNVTIPPSKDEISNIIEWNKKHGLIWLVYGICIELGFLLGLIMPVEELEMLFMIGGIVLPLPFMVLRHHYLVKRYKNED